jgi:hypothetical protein
MKLKKFNVVYGALLVSLLVAEMCVNAIIDFYVIRILQLLIIINSIALGFKSFEKNIFIFLIPSIIFFFSAIFYSSIDFVFGEIFNLFWWVIFMLIMNYSINNIFEFDKFKKILFRSTFILTSIASILGLIKLNFPNASFFENINNSEIIIGTSLNSDYNVFSIGLYCGLFAGLYCYQNSIKLVTKILFSFFILVILLSSLISGSRRGFILGIIILFYIVYTSFKDKSYNIRLNVSKSKLNQIKIPWIVIVFFIILILIMINLDLSSIIDSNTEIYSVKDRLLTINEITSKDNDTRSNRWEYALDLFSNESLISQFFGNGFEYLTKIGNNFRDAIYDYPHNVWISALLYGGFLGFFSTIFLTIYVLIFFYKNKHIFNEILVWYLLFLFLLFSSGNTIYSSRVFIVLMLFPFLSFYNTDNK